MWKVGVCGSAGVCMGVGCGECAGVTVQVCVRGKVSYSVLGIFAWRQECHSIHSELLGSC